MAASVRAGDFPTYPVFVAGDVVVKFFGHTAQWQLDFETEVAAHSILEQVPDLPVPGLLAHGGLYDGPDPWLYLVTERLRGRPWRDLQLAPPSRASIARQLGEIMRVIHDIAVPMENQRGRLGRDWLNDFGDECVARQRGWGTIPATS